MAYGVPANVPADLASSRRIHHIYALFDNFRKGALALPEEPQCSFNPSTTLFSCVLSWPVRPRRTWAYDQWRNNPEPNVMRAGFVPVTLYMGPLGLLLYVLADKEPSPGTHEQFIKPLWKQGVGSTIHCVAGDAT
jgi:hypothetical protein